MIIPRTVLATGIWSTRVPPVVGSDPTGDGSVVMSNEKDLVTRVSEVVDGEFVKLFDVRDGIRWCVCCCFEGQLLFLRGTGGSTNTSERVQIRLSRLGGTKIR